MPDKPDKETVRATISLNQVVDRMAKEMMELKGYDNFSAYIADLIRRDKEREEERRDRQAALLKGGHNPEPAKRKAAS